ncbi:hypothetical protein K6U06_19425 [Acidiferrimicrobium sp. IK]|uniref:hypothetical protein n=1 Tax=Acidiferrimicrobium sp. IK TaxID=2871700 RepID=UPI0021CB36D3|nr:hypothetical protein [Acidiferrimicrobium sp. IK]MCU4186547.1 hypothetical protein [Acidiferrimicrobium sp. IK]
MPPLLTFASDSMTIRPWPDDVVDRVGFDPRSVYVERFWLGVLGPSTTWLLRRLAAGFDDAPDGFVLDLGETARSIGLGDRGGRHSPFLRSVNRMMQFEMAFLVGPDELAVRRRLPPLNRRQLVRLSEAQQADHARWQQRQLDAPGDDAQRRRSRQLALSLLELGEGAEEAERQLLRWRYPPLLAREAADWAAARHRSAEAAAQAG